MRRQYELALGTTFRHEKHQERGSYPVLTLEGKVRPQGLLPLPRPTLQPSWCLVRQYLSITFGNDGLDLAPANFYHICLACDEDWWHLALMVN